MICTTARTLYIGLEGQRHVTWADDHVGDPKAKYESITGKIEPGNLSDRPSDETARTRRVASYMSVRRGRESTWRGRG